MIITINTHIYIYHHTYTRKKWQTCHLGVLQILYRKTIVFLISAAPHDMTLTIWSPIEKDSCWWCNTLVLCKLHWWPFENPYPEIRDGPLWLVSTCRPFSRSPMLGSIFGFMLDFAEPSDMLKLMHCGITSTSHPGLGFCLWVHFGQHYQWPEVRARKGASLTQ